MLGRLPAKTPMVELSPTPSTSIDSERCSVRRDIMGFVSRHDAVFIRLIDYGRY
jgi:hypothetical protein